MRTVTYFLEKMKNPIYKSRKTTVLIYNLGERINIINIKTYNFLTVRAKNALQGKESKPPPHLVRGEQG